MTKQKLISILGKICVPIDPRDLDAFKVMEVPTLTSVINELGLGNNAREDGGSVTPPCLAPYMETFHYFLKTIDNKRIKAI